MANVNAMIEDGIRKLKPFVIKHKIVLLCAVVFLVLMIIGNSMHSSANNAIAAAERELADVNNEIAQFDSQKHDVKVETKHIDYGLDTARWKIDDTIAAGWIQPAFTWRNSTEYTENRDLYINRLTEHDPFVTSFMPTYVPKYQEQTNETGAIDDGTNISSRITSFKSYVVNVDETTDTYSYLALLRCEVSIPIKYDYNGPLIGRDAQGGPCENVIIITYDINKDGDLVNFSVFMNYYDGYTPKLVGNETT